jgi:hypothetical protein
MNEPYDQILTPMTIVYALVARKKVVLAEYTSSSGNFPTVTRVLLSKIPEEDGKMSYVYDKHIFHFIVDSGITFLCMADDQMKRRIAFSFLDEIKTLWRRNYSAEEQTALAFAMNELFSPILKAKTESFASNGPSSDNLTKVQAQLDSVKDVMVENIDRVLQRGEKIELLVDKSERLSTQAKKFEKSVNMQIIEKASFEVSQCACPLDILIFLLVEISQKYNAMA